MPQVGCRNHHPCTPGLLLALGILAAITAPGVPAQADPTWLPPEIISPGGDTCGSPQVAMQGNGSLTSVWRHSGSEALGTFIEATDRPAGGSYAPPYALSDSSTSVYGPALAMKSDGEAIATWPWWSGSVYWLQAAIRPAGGAFGLPTAISDPSWSVDQHSVTLDPSGNAVAAWEFNRVFQGRTNYLVHTSIKPPGQPFEPPEIVSGRSDYKFGPRVASDRSGLGAAVVVWSKIWSRLGSSYVEAAVKDPGDTGFRNGVTISDPVGDADAPAVALDGAGNAVVLWQRWDRTFLIWRVQAAFHKPGGPFSAPTYLTGPPGSAFAPSVAADDAGNAVAAWHKRDTDFTPRIQASVRPAGGTFEPPVYLSPAGLEAWDPFVAMNSSGMAIVTWRQWDAAYSRLRVHVVVRPPGGPFGTPVVVSEGDSNLLTYEPRAAIDDDGNAVIVWEAYHWIVKDQVIRAAGYDAVGPRLLDLWIPIQGAIGEELWFSVRPVDTWSQVVTTTWDFGDGSSAEGTVVSHAYVATGSYHVTVTSTDAVGNSSSAEGTVIVDRLNDIHATKGGHR